MLRVRVHEDYGYAGFFWDVALTTDRLIDLWLAGEATPYIPMKRHGNLIQLWGEDDQGMDIDRALAGIKKLDSYRNSPYIETDNWCLSVIKHGKWQRYFFNSYIKP